MLLFPIVKHFLEKRVLLVVRVQPLPRELGDEVIGFGSKLLRRVSIGFLLGQLEARRRGEPRLIYWVLQEGPALRILGTWLRLRLVRIQRDGRSGIRVWKTLHEFPT